MPIFALTSFVIAVLTLIVSILALLFGSKEHRARTIAGVLLLVLALAFGLIGVVSLLGTASISTQPTSTPTASPVIAQPAGATTPDCSLTSELGPWPNPLDIEINPERDGWTQADFWVPGRQLRPGYDEVSVIFEPGLDVTVVNVAGIAWKYEKTWSRADVEWCTSKHVDDSWTIRHKRLVVITPAELCTLVICR